MLDKQKAFECPKNYLRLLGRYHKKRSYGWVSLSNKILKSLSLLCVQLAKKYSKQLKTLNMRACIVKFVPLLGKAQKSS